MFKEYSISSRSLIARAVALMSADFSWVEIKPASELSFYSADMPSLMENRREWAISFNPDFITRPISYRLPVFEIQADNPDYHRELGQASLQQTCMGHAGDWFPNHAVFAENGWARSMEMINHLSRTSGISLNRGSLIQAYRFTGFTPLKPVAR
jgi:hypothetical protein